MIEPLKRRIPVNPDYEKPNEVEFQPTEVPEADLKVDFTAILNSTYAANALRPPEIQFADNNRLGGPLFEAQAIESMDILKANAQEASLNTLASLIVTNSPDIDKNGSPEAKEGLKTLDEMLQMTATLLAARMGKNG